MNYKKAFIFLTSLSLTFCALGGSIGYFIGTKYPGYYRSLFHRGNEPTFDPVAVGVGQGIVQGFIGGAVVGILVILIMMKFQKNNEVITS